MRQFLVPGALAAAAVLATLTMDSGNRAEAQQARYCAHYDWSTVNCGFHTRAQCLATVSGIGGYCSRELYGPRVYGYVHGSDTPAPPRRRTAPRD